MRYVGEGLGGSAQYEVRLDRIGRTSSARVAYLIAGESGPYLVGPSFYDGRLASYEGCATLRGAECRNAVGPWRYRLSTGAYQRGTPGERNISGFADTGAELYEVLGCWPADYVASEPFAGCRIDALKPPAYPASRPPLG